MSGDEGSITMTPVLYWAASSTSDAVYWIPSTPKPDVGNSVLVIETT